MEPEKKTALQQIIGSTVVMDLDDLRTVMHEILEEYLESHVNDNEEYLSTEEVIEILNISKKTFQKYRRDGRIPYIHRGRKIYVKRSDLDAFQERNRIKPWYER